ncbi:DUF6283 family protein [Burkholderia ubonensis]|uniref:DUF6283 family protein n=1 Tax=Burkholderia ubonensis TaxID=101571 RepID=UPI000AD47BA5|nr:DUF6283 family protein [Burkholderia ubonensis]
MSKSCSLNSLAKPCASCPWRKDSTAADIPNFSMELAEGLAECSPDERNMGPNLGAKMFACHQSKHGEEFACAGWLAVAGNAHPEVRLAVFRKELDPAALRPGPDWPELHETYPEVLEKLRATLPGTGD